MSFAWHQFKNRVLAALTRAAAAIATVAAILVGGIGSSWYMVEAGSRLTTTRDGPWALWRSAGRQDADPYTKAHFSRAAILPLSSDLGAMHVATTDEDGERLTSTCEYVLRGTPPAGTWWSLAVFDAKGRLIPNPAGRHSFSSDTVALNPDGSVTLALSRYARPGNWLPTGGAGRLVLTLTVLEPTPATTALPTIRKTQCR